MAAVVPSTGEGGVPPKRKRGRKKLEGTLIINVRLPISIYDIYCRVALRMRPGTKVRTVLRHVLTIHAPTEGEGHGRS